MSKTVSITKTENKVSICDIMKNNTSEVIKKIESQAPSLMQKYSDLYMTYLHTIDDISGTCYISEKEFFDKLNIDQGILKEAEKFSGVLPKIYLNQIKKSYRKLALKYHPDRTIKISRDICSDASISTQNI